MFLENRKLAFVYGLLAGVALLWLLWLCAFPWEVSSDDAFNFVKGLERFSVLEFRPHFPGYPGMMAGGHLMAFFVNTQSSEQALFLFSILSAWLIPFLLGYLSYVLVASQYLAVLTALVAFASPLLAGLALSALSDGPAIACMLIALIFAIKNKLFVAAFFLAFMLAVRPSYIVIALAFFPFIVIQTKPVRSCLMVSLPILLVGSLSLAFLIAKDGLAYFSEGLRFTQGHFEIWGNTAENQSAYLAWFYQLQDKLGLAILLIFIIAMIQTLRSSDIKLKICAFIALVYCLAILIGQNPDNFRHFAPVYFICLVLVFIYIRQLKSKLNQLQYALITCLLLVFFVYKNMPYWWQNIQASPTQQAINYLNSKIDQAADNCCFVLGTNYSVSLLREALKDFSVYDYYYPSSQQHLLKQSQKNSVWRLSGMPLVDKTETMPFVLEQQFNARFPTERNLYLYSLSRD